MKVIKRDGRAVEYNSEKICTAIEKANKEVAEEKRATIDEISKIIEYIESLGKKRILVEDIQDLIEQKLMEIGKYELAKSYIVYRYTRALVRKQNTTDESILGLIKNASNGGDNGDEKRSLVCVQRNLIAGEVSKDLTKRILLPEKITKAHDEGILYFHDMEYFMQPIINSCVVNIEDMLDNGTEINHCKIGTPQGFEEACVVVANIINVISNSQYGKQIINIKHLGKYLRKSSEKIERELSNCLKNGIKTENYSDELLNRLKELKLKEELYNGIKILKYQIESIVNTYDKDSKIVLVLDIAEKSDFSAENSMIVSEIKKQNIGNCTYVLNESNEDENGKYQCEGHFNYGMVSINLLQIIRSINNNENEFWKLLETRLELCYEALMCRHYSLLGIISNVSPIHWQNGAISRLNVDDRIDKLLKDGYSDMYLGYYGLNDTVELAGEKFGFDDGLKEKFENKLIRFLEDKVQTWKKMTGIDFVLKEKFSIDG